MHVRLFGLVLATALATVAVGVPAAQAASGYVVTVTPAGSTTCAETVASVATSYAITPTATYTSTTCGFAASLTKPQVRSLQTDARITSVQFDYGFTTS